MLKYWLERDFTPIAWWTHAPPHIDLALYGLSDLDLLSIELRFYYVEVVISTLIYVYWCLIDDEESMWTNVWRLEHALTS